VCGRKRERDVLEKEYDYICVYVYIRIYEYVLEMCYVQREIEKGSAESVERRICHVSYVRNIHTHIHTYLCV
jgi:hypothetical protein